MTFDVLYVFVVLSLERRRILHVNVTSHPYADWAARQIVEAFGEDGTFFGFSFVTATRSSVKPSIAAWTTLESNRSNSPHRAAFTLAEWLRRTARRDIST